MDDVRRISIILPDLRGGGAERVSIDLADALASFRYPVEFVLAQGKGELLPEALARHNVVNLDVSQMREVVYPLWRHIRQHRPVGIVAVMWPLTVIGPVAARLARYGGPVLTVEHGVLSRQYARWGPLHRLSLRASLNVGLRLATARAAVSRGAAKDVARLGNFAHERVTVLHNPIPPRPAPPLVGHAEAEALWPSTKGRRIITVGNLKRVKNQTVLLRAFQRLSAPDACLMLLGHGEMERELKQLSNDLGVADRIVFAGFRRDPTPFYDTADLFVLSSDHEGLPTVMIEALGRGLPVVSTDCPSGPAEILENGKWGRLVPVGDAEALARAMEEALVTPVDRDALKRRAADFSPEIAARKYLDVLGLA